MKAGYPPVTDSDLGAMSTLVWTMGVRLSSERWPVSWRSLGDMFVQETIKDLIYHNCSLASG